MIVTFAYRLYPTPEQACRFADTLEILRHLYNNALAERIDAYRYEGKSLSYEDQAKALPALKKIAPPLTTIYSQVLQECLKRLDKAYQSFFRRVTAGGTPGFPRFKGKGQYHSFCYPGYANSVKIEEGCLCLAKIGRVPIRLHRPLQGKAKTCTITKKADGWYACIACEVEAQALPQTGKEVGIDVGIEHFATLTEEHESIPNPRPLQKAQAQLRKAQRRLERRSRRDRNGKLLPGQSKRREKAKEQLARLHQKVARIRKDFHYKTVSKLLKRFDVIYVEKLNIVGMLKNHHLARAISDVGWGQFFQILKTQAERAVKVVVEVVARNTSQNCCGCGEHVPKALSVRTHSCPYCGLVLHRDKNAAQNIKKQGRAATIRRQREAIACA